jgi:putative transport protein
LVAAGVVVTSIPVAIGYLFGRYVLKIYPVLLTGAITGSIASGEHPSIVKESEPDTN